MVRVYSVRVTGHNLYEINERINTQTESLTRSNSAKCT